jgi:hypothetical protein
VKGLAFVLLTSALKLLNVSNRYTIIALAMILLFAPFAWMLVRRRHGFFAFAARVPAEGLRAVATAAATEGRYQVRSSFRISRPKCFSLSS